MAPRACLKELDESTLRLCHLADAAIVAPRRLEALRAETGERRRIFVTIIKGARATR